MNLFSYLFIFCRWIIVVLLFNPSSSLSRPLLLLLLYLQPYLLSLSFPLFPSRIPLLSPRVSSSLYLHLLVIVSSHSPPSSTSSLLCCVYCLLKLEQELNSFGAPGSNVVVSWQADDSGGQASGNLTK